MSKKDWIRAGKILLSFALGAILVGVLWHNLKGQGEVVRTMFGDVLANGWMIVLAEISYIIAVYIRAHRWQVMLGEKGMIWHGFRSVSLGYMVSMALSRVGELVRVANFKRYTGIPVGRLVSTVFVDRLLDVLCFICMLAYCLNLAGEELSHKFNGFEDSIKVFSFSLLAGVLGIALMLIFGKQVQGWIRSLQFIPERIGEWLASFLGRMCEGLASVKSPLTLIYLFVSSILIWAGYFLTGYMTMKAIPVLYGLELNQALVIFACGTLGMIIPAPGGMGSFHFFAQAGLMMVGISGMSDKLALSIAAVLWVFQIFLFTVLTGFICWIYQRFNPPPVDGEES